MATRYAVVRTKTDDVDDPDPNTTAPDASAVMVNNRGESSGFQAFLSFADGESCTVTAWARDVNASADPQYVQISAPLTGVGPNRLFVQLDCGPADVYLQITDRTDDSDLDVHMAPLGGG